MGRYTIGKHRLMVRLFNGSRVTRLLPAVGTLLVALPLALNAQVAITSISTLLTTESGGDYESGAITSTEGGGSATFAATNNDLEVTSFKDSAGDTYTYTAGGAANATAAIVRRNAATTGSGTDTQANTDGMSVWYAYTGASSTSLAAAYDTNGNNVLLGNNLYVGSDNTFINNNASTSPNQSDVERIDFLLGTTSTVGSNTVSAGIAASSDLTFAVFDRGAVNAHDSFDIALITGYDVSGNPIYTDASISGLKVDQAVAATYGSTNVDSSFNYDLFRYDNGQGNNLNNDWNADSETGSQGVGGVAFTLADFGITGAELTGLTIYGYSVMGADDTTSLANLVGNNYSNSTYYPTNTTDSGQPDGLDLVAVNGAGFMETSSTPEPATYGAILAGLGLLMFLALSRRRTGAVKATTT
jgi:hypothetical protein